MVFVALDHAHTTVQVGVCPLGIIGKLAHQPVCFQVGFIDQINTTSLKLWEKVTKKEKDLSINSGLGGIGICNVSAEQITKFVESDEKTRMISASIGKDESTEDLTTNKIEFLPKDQVITFSVKKDKVDLKNTSTTIATENYNLEYNADDKTLIFKKGKAKK